MLKLADLKIKTKKQITSKNNKLSYLAIITLEQKKQTVTNLRSV